VPETKEKNRAQRRRKMKNAFFVSLFGAAVVFGMLSLGYCETGVTDTEIHIGQWGPRAGRRLLGGRR
jgi:hypothetical protein